MSLEDRTPTKEQIFEHVRGVLEAEFGLAGVEIRGPSDLIDELDLDSIDAVDLAASMEDSLGLLLRDDDLKAVRTVQDVVDRIHRGLVAKRAAVR